MKVILLSPYDLGAAAFLVALDAALSLALRLGLHRQIGVAAFRMIVQLVAAGFLLRVVFRLANPLATVSLVAIMLLVAAREVAARSDARFKDNSVFWLSAASVALATGVTALLALTTAIRPHPWFDPRYAVPLAGIILGNVLNAASLSLHTLLGGARRERAAVEAQLCLGRSYWQAIGPLLRRAIRQGLLPIINQMSAAGVVTLPGIMTGQILAGLDPLEAVKYQILLMFLLSGGSGLAALAISYGAAWRLTDHRQRLRLDRLR